MRPEPTTPFVPPAIRNGVLVLGGYGLRVAVERRHLIVSDGIGKDRRWGRFSKATCGLRRLVILGHTGTVSLEALRWLHDVGASLMQIDADGRVIIASGPVHLNDARLRRAQALAVANGLGLKIARDLAHAKMTGQASVVESLAESAGAFAVIQRANDALWHAETVERLRILEAEAAKAYWDAWRFMPVRFGQRDKKRVPDHWRAFGMRASPFTGSPRLAANPANALLNYVYAILEAEARIATLAVGLDPGLGMLHADQRSRDSLVCDVIEPVRPQVDAWVLSLLRDRTFGIHNFAETRQGVCRVLPPLTRLLAETAPTWRRAVAPVAERIAHKLLDGKNGETRNHQRALATPLTQTHRSAGRDRVRRHPHRVPASDSPTMPQACRMCGVILDKLGRLYCDDCLLEARQDVAKPWSSKGLKTLANLRAEGKDPAHGGKAARKRGRRVAQFKRETAGWQQVHGDSYVSRYFVRNVLPKLKRMSLGEMTRRTGLTPGYCSFIRRGMRVPHPRHWDALRRVGTDTGNSGFVV